MPFAIFYGTVPRKDGYFARTIGSKREGRREGGLIFVLFQLCTCCRNMSLSLFVGSKVHSVPCSINGVWPLTWPRTARLRGRERQGLEGTSQQVRAAAVMDDRNDSRKEQEFVVYINHLIFERCDSINKSHFVAINRSKKGWFFATYMRARARRTCVGHSFAVGLWVVFCPRVSVSTMRESCLTIYNPKADAE